MPTSTFLARHYPESTFGGFTDVDGTVAFYNRVNALVAPISVVLDVGCGRGEYAADAVAFRRDLRVLRGRVRKVVGIDFDRAAAANPFVDEFHLLQGGNWPVATGTIDLVLADWVMEHVADPPSFLAEAFRVLVPGGHLCLRTTNRLGYVGLVASLVPNRAHGKMAQYAQGDRDEQDVFPTLYRCNTVGRLRRELTRQGFAHCVYGHQAEPSYLNFSHAAYVLGTLYQRLAPRRLGNTLLAFARK